jgi:hypothetical protein
MLMQSIQSSNIKAAGYENNTLRVRFTNGTEYDYKGVSPQMFDGLLLAKSQGKFFNTVIRKKFNGVKVEKENNDG